MTFSLLHSHLFSQNPSADSKIALCVELRGITKRFGATLANEMISFRVKPGTIHGLLGENGAGKTTLMKILVGALQPDSGSILIDGQPVVVRSPRKARDLGIGMVHQYLTIIPALTVAENLLIDDPTPPIMFRPSRYGSALMAQANGLGINIDLTRPVWHLSLAERQLLEVVRLLIRGCRLLILDEPTSYLSPPEAERLLSRVKELTAEGMTVILVTHKLHELEQFADTITVLRKGNSVLTCPPQETTRSELIKAMIGAESMHLVEETSNPPGPAPDSNIVVRVERLSARRPDGQLAFRDLNFALKSGNILGVAGLAGNGQEELAQSIAGLLRPVSGSILFSNHRAVTVGYIPADRVGVGAPPLLMVAENLTLRDYYCSPISKRGILKWSTLIEVAETRSSAYGVVTPSVLVPTSQLSGGNHQRIVVARELSRHLDVLVAHDPTSGLDVRAAAFVQEQIRIIAQQGVAVLLISYDLDELLSSSDEVMVLYHGAIKGVFPIAAVDRLRLGNLMIGETGWLAV